MPPPTRREGSLLRACGILAALWLFAFTPQIVFHLTFVRGDARIYQPFAEFSRERWRDLHQRTFWNPYVLTGVSAQASLADMRPQYLPDAALDLFEAIRPGRFVPMAGPIVTHLAGMCAMAALAFALWRLPTVALVWAGLAWGFCPIVLAPVGFGHTAYSVAVWLMPGILLCVHELTAAPPRRAMLAGLALAMLSGLQALNGHPQVVAYTGALAVAFAIERAVSQRRPMRIAIAVLALAWGAAIACAVWLPAMRYGEHSVRAMFGLPIEQVRGMSIAWREIASFALPQAVGNAAHTYWGGLGTTDYPRFFGTLVVLFAACGLARGRALADGRGFLVALCAVAVAMALGPRFAPLYDLVSRIPVLERFRVASMVLVVAAPAIALLSASGLAGMVASDGARRGVPRALWLVPILLLAFGLLLWLPAGARAYAAMAMRLRPDFALDLAQHAARAAAVDLALRSLLVAAALALVASWARFRPAAALLTLLLVIDLSFTSLFTLHHASGPESELTSEPEPALARYGREDSTARVLSARTRDVSHWQISGLGLRPEMETNDWIRWRAHAYGGDHGTPPAYWQEFLFLPSVEAMRAMGVVYLSSPPDVAQDSTRWERLERAEQEDVYRLRDPLGRAYAVERVQAVDQEATVVRAMLAGDFRAERVAYTLDPGAAGEYPGSPGARITWLTDGPDRLVLRVSAAAPVFVVIADAWWPGWSAELDRATVPIRRVNHSLRGMALPAGDHRLSLRFIPEGWAVGVDVTRVALALWIAVALAALAIGGLRRRASG